MVALSRRIRRTSWLVHQADGDVGLVYGLSSAIVGGGERHETLNRVSEDVPAPKDLRGSRLPHPGPLPRTKVSSMSDSGMGGKDGRFEEDTDLTHPT